MKFDDNAFLIKRLQNGDEKAYIYLVDLYNRRLFGYALSLSNDHALAEDILQNVFLKTWDLPPKCQQIFVLSKKEGLTNIEISEYLNVSKKTVEAQITKAFGILRERLGKKYDMLLFIFFGRKTNRLV